MLLNEIPMDKVNNVLSRGEVHFVNISKVTKIISPSEFLRIARNNRSSIKSSKIVPPKIGSNSLGEILVEFYHEPK